MPSQTLTSKDTVKKQITWAREVTVHQDNNAQDVNEEAAREGKQIKDNIWSVDSLVDDYDQNKVKKHTLNTINSNFEDSNSVKNLPTLTLRRQWEQRFDNWMKQGQKPENDPGKHPEKDHPWNIDKKLFLAGYKDDNFDAY